MKKILSIMLVIACILCATSCGNVKPSEATTFDEISDILEERAETFRICDEEEIQSHEDFFSSEYSDYIDVIDKMCYAQIDGKYVKCMEMYYPYSAEAFENSFGNNFDYVVRKDNIVLFGTSPVIAEFKAD